MSPAAKIFKKFRRIHANTADMKKHLFDSQRTFGFQAKKGYGIRTQNDFVIEAKVIEVIVTAGS